MRTPSFIRSISSKLPSSKRLASPVVVPLPQESQFFQQVTSELDALQSSSYNVGSANWLVDVLDASIATQKLAQEYLSITKSDLSDMEKDLINDYLEDNVEMLDACNDLVEKMSKIQEYVDSLKSAMRSTHASEALSNCDQLEKECKRLDKRVIEPCRLSTGRNIKQVSTSYEMYEVLSMSKEVASVACHRVQRALSFKSKQGLTRMKSKISPVWSSSLNEMLAVKEGVDQQQKKCASPWMMNELEQVVMVSKMLHDQVKCHKGNVDMDLFRKSSDSLEDGVKIIEERVRELYRHLISVRMALLSILSQN